MLTELVMIAKDFALLIFWILLGGLLLWLISHIFMMIYKTLFCDFQIKLYKVCKKQLKRYLNDEELKEILYKIKEKQSK